MTKIRTVRSTSKQAAGLSVRTGLTAGSITVYGKQSCPWTVKQLNYFDQKGTSYRFVDCASQTCPEFVQAFPTIDYHGQFHIGFKEY
ncbi:MAG TPA: hypothetical protein P5526_11715 [Anaerolineae bacterium]|nr:hypothetical protein [Anaerolineae bacterium]MCB0178751.1 hypothetical protein [Anaerolineae bacterium]MCB0225642.1 hypothetical protein [Anaerolineae bacterium]MCB9103012.1 hypothetical protein [Anaerolineales bacterium]HRV92822.1 hypothetical protein [Anaerolineae bacterium]